jgi:hypothetical protein
VVALSDMQCDLRILRRCARSAVAELHPALKISTHAPGSGPLSGYGRHQTSVH